MDAPKMTYLEAVKESWKKEMQIKDPRRILRLAYWTVYLSVYRVFVVLIPRYVRARYVQLLNLIPGVHAEIKPPRNTE